MTVVLAHAGHWLASLLYVIPIVVVLGALLYQVVREKRASERERDDPPVTP